jgi:hypothetical protein
MFEQPILLRVIRTTNKSVVVILILGAGHMRTQQVRRRASRENRR